MEEYLTQNNAFKDANGSILATLIGGSHLYGLNTPESDIDYRGIFAVSDKRYVAGIKNIESLGGRYEYRIIRREETQT